MSFITRSTFVGHSARRRILVASTSLAMIAASLFVLSAPASAGIVPTIDLATAGDYSVLAATTVFNSNPSVLDQSVGLSPGSSVVGFPPGIVNAPGTIHAADAVALQAQSDLSAAYVDATLRSVEFPSTNADLVGLTLAPGVYAAAAMAPLELSGELVLDGQGDSDAVFIFRTDSTLITSSGSSIRLINGALECNIFWQVGSSATLGSGSTFVGNVMALTAITVESNVAVHGRALALTAAVTLDDDVFTSPNCTPEVVVTTTTADTSTTTTVGEATTTTTTVGGTSTTVVGTSTTVADTPTTSTGNGGGTTTTLTANEVPTTTVTLPGRRLPRTGGGTGLTASAIAGGAAITFGAVVLLAARRRRPV